MFTLNIFQLKQRAWLYWQRLMGAERAYAKYLKHFAHYQAHHVDPALQQSLGLSPMSKETFLAAWQKKIGKPTTKQCGCNSNGCH